MEEVKPKRDRNEYHRLYHNARRKRIDWPKCSQCGFTARWYPDIGCLECYANKQPRRKWSRLEIDMVELYAGKDGPAHLQLRIYQETGQARTRDAIRCRTKYMGIKIRNHQEGYTIKQLMEITGRPYSTIMCLINEGVIQNIGRGRRVLISNEDGEKVIMRYTTSHDRPSYSIAEVMTLLGYTKGSVHAAVRNGLPSWKIGHTRHICKVTVDRAIDYLKKTGKLRLHWRLLAKQGEAP